MIHLPLKNNTNPPARLSVAGALEQLRRAVEAADGNHFNSTYYPDQQVRDLLRAFSLHKLVLSPGDQPKCYYCESQAEEALTLRVEHYRPKARLDPNDNNNIAGPGYYWLGLEWTNLLLSCEKCNESGAKGSRFPIRGARYQPILPIDLQYLYTRANCLAANNPLILEDPLLLNPEIDHPEQYLTFIPQGYMEAHGQDIQKGETTVQILKLNRDSLIIKRAKILNDINNRLLFHVYNHQTGRTTDDVLHALFKDKAMDLIERKEVSMPYTLWGRYINDHLQQCVLDQLPEAYRQKFTDAYQETLNEYQP